MWVAHILLASASSLASKILPVTSFDEVESARTGAENARPMDTANVAKRVGFVISVFLPVVAETLFGLSGKPVRPLNTSTF